jgi:hypothetical protein
MRFSLIIFSAFFLMTAMCPCHSFIKACWGDEPGISNIKLIYPKDIPKIYEGIAHITKTENGAVLDVPREWEIGRLKIVLLEGKWTKQVLVRFHFAGLEGVEVSNGKVHLTANDLDVQAFDKDGNPVKDKYLMYRSGYYEVKLPDSLFGAGITEVEMAWVNFFRN